MVHFMDGVGPSRFSERAAARPDLDIGRDPVLRVRDLR